MKPAASDFSAMGFVRGPLEVPPQRLAAICAGSRPAICSGSRAGTRGMARLGRRFAATRGPRLLDKARPRRPGPRRYYFIEVNVPESSAGRRRPTSTQLSWRRAVDKSFAPVRRPRWARRRTARSQPPANRTLSEPRRPAGEAVRLRESHASRRVASRRAPAKCGRRIAPRADLRRSRFPPLAAGFVATPPTRSRAESANRPRADPSIQPVDGVASVPPIPAITEQVCRRRAAIEPPSRRPSHFRTASHPHATGPSIRPARAQRVLPLIYDTIPALPAPQVLRTGRSGFAPGPAGGQAQPLT